MNPHFRKGGKAKQGSGHLWVLADYDKEDQLPHVHVQQQSQQQLEQPNTSHSNVNQLQNSNLNVTERVTGPNFSDPLKPYAQRDKSVKVRILITAIHCTVGLYVCNYKINPMENNSCLLHFNYLEFNIYFPRERG